MMKKLASWMAVIGIAVVGVQAEDIVVSWETNGMLVAEGLESWSTGVVEAVSSMGEPFTNAASFFDAEYVVDSNGMIRVAVPMFFRVKGTPAAEEPLVSEIPAGTNSGTNPLGDGESYNSDSYPENYSLTVDAFYMDTYEATNDEIVRVLQWAYDHGKLTVSASSVKNAAGNIRELLDLDDSDCGITWNGSTFAMKSAKGSGYPCVEISWYGAAAYCNYRSEMKGKTPCYNLTDWSCDLDAGGYRMPTSDEWEYAARGGLNSMRFPWGDTITHSQANYDSSSSDSYDTSPTRGRHPDYDTDPTPYTSPAGDFATNGYGLHDMAGNVWEWCTDWRPNYVDSRVIRGGSWTDNAFYVRCGRMHGSGMGVMANGLGFRAVLPVQ